MKNLKISIQSGLKEFSDYLKSQGYDVCEMGKNDNDASIAIINVPDFEYEGLSSNTECRNYGDNEKLLVINAYNRSVEDIHRIISNKTSVCIN